ncbi:MAG: ankyrin repeat domain-containing protein, partial [Planctomycetota bacterium]
MRHVLPCVVLAGFAIAMLAITGRLASAEPAETVDIFTATAAGDLDGIRAYLDAGGSPDAKQPGSGITPLMAAAIHGRSDAAKLLIERGADVNLASGDGSTPLHAAAFFCRPEVVALLLDKGAEINRRNARSETPLDTVAGPWSDDLANVYRTLSAALHVTVDLDAVRRARPAVAALLRRRGGRPGRIPIRPVGYRGAYFLNGAIYVNEFGTPEEKPITSGHWDFKPSWSKEDRLVFFRRLKDDPEVTNWITQVHVVNVDGSGLHPISDGTHTDFNPTWTRDGTNTPIWNRRHPDRVSFYVMTNDADGKPGEERPLTDMHYH